MMAEMVGFIAKIAMETSMDTKEGQGKYVRYNYIGNNYIGKVRTFI